MDPSYYEEWTSRIKSFVLANDLNRIKYYLDQRPRNVKSRITGRNVQGKSAMLEACELQRYSVIRYFVEDCGTDVNVTSDEGVTPVITACSLGDVALLEYLYSYGGNINTVDDKLRSLLMRFVQNASICNVLLSRGADVHLLDEDDKTALDYALSTSSIRTLELLIQNGADVNQRNADGNYPIEEACHKVSQDVLRVLLHYGASINTKDICGKTLLMRFINKSDVCKLLLLYSIDANAVDDSGMTALHYAVGKRADSKVLPLLLEHVADVNAKDFKGLTPAAHSINSMNIYSLKCLLQKGADVNAVDLSNSSLLHCAVEIENLEAIKLLAEFGVQINVYNEKGIEPIIKAACKNNSKIVEYFIQHLDVGKVSKINALELLASNELMDLNYFDAIGYLKSAMQLRMCNGHLVKSTTLLNDLFPNVQEPESLDEVDSLDQNVMQIQSALIRGRILGPFDVSVLNVLEMLTDADDGDLDTTRVISIKQHMNAIALNEYGVKDRRPADFKKETVYYLGRLNPSQRQMKTMLEVLSDCLEHAGRALPYYTSDNQGTLELLFHQCMLLIYLCMMDDTKDVNKSAIETKFTDLVSKCPDENISSKLIHFILDEIRIFGGLYVPFKPEIFLNILIFLLSKRVNVSSEESCSRSTPLHKYLRLYPNVLQDTNDTEIIHRTIRLLINNGNHICREDINFDTILELLQSNSSYPICEVRDRTLQCLAAGVVANRNISFNELPSHLQEFVQQHEDFVRPPSRSVLPLTVSPINFNLLINSPPYLSDLSDLIWDSS